MRVQWHRWRRDLVVGALASCLTAVVLVPVGWGAVRYQRQQTAAALEQEVREALRQAEQSAAEVRRERERVARKLIGEAADLFFPEPEQRAEGEIMRVSTDAVAPEVPRGSHLLVDKKASSYAAGDIVVFRAEDRNYLGRVVAVDRGSGRLTIARKGEPNRVVAPSDLIGRGVMNTR